MTRRLLVPGLVYAGILGLSSIPGDAAPPLWAGVGTIAHAVEYATLAVALHWALPDTAEGANAAAHARKVTAVVGICLLLGIGDEAYQSTVPGRSPQLVDVAVDVASAFVAASIASRLRQVG